jgi:hypothetical protein
MKKKKSISDVFDESLHMHNLLDGEKLTSESKELTNQEKMLEKAKQQDKVYY